MPFGPLSLCCLCIVDDRDKPVPIVPDVKDHIVIHIVSIPERALYFRKIVPPDCFNDGRPRFDFVRCILMSFHRLVQMLLRDDVHSSIILHIL